MNCSICNKKGIPANSLLCPSCGSLMDREEIIHAEDEKRATAREMSLLRGKVVELRQKRDRYKQRNENKKILVYLLSAGLVWALFFKGSKKPSIHPVTQELRDSLSSYSTEVKKLRSLIYDLKPTSSIPEPEPSAKLTVHTVRKGDCLAKIADTYLGDYTRFEELASLNNLNYPYTLRSGDQIKINVLPEPK